MMLSRNLDGNIRKHDCHMPNSNHVIGFPGSKVFA
jgi:hypothetical protein